MADQEHTRIIRRGAKFWNEWRQRNPTTAPDLSGENLSADVHVANMDHWLDGAPVINPETIDLRAINLVNTNLSNVNLSGQDLTGSNLKGANLTGANLSGCRLIRADLADACLDGCYAFGVAVWTANLEGTSQRGIVITPPDESEITCDHLGVAQFLYLILNNTAVRDVVDTLTTKAVLILGRFTPNRKAVLDGVRDELRLHNYVPIMFDFEKPKSRGFTETVKTLAQLARFVIADITDATEVRAELASIIPHIPSVPVRALVVGEAYATFEDWRKYPWVLPVLRYETQSELLAALRTAVIEPAEAWLAEHHHVAS